MDSTPFSTPFPAAISVAPSPADAETAEAAASFRDRRRFPSSGGMIVVHDVELARLARAARRERRRAETAAPTERAVAAA